MEHQSLKARMSERADRWAVATAVTVFVAPLIGLVLAFAALIARVVFFLVYGVWVSSLCGALENIVALGVLRERCFIETGLVGLDKVIIYILRNLDVSFSILAVSVSVMPLAFVIGFVAIRILVFLFDIDQNAGN